MGPAEIAALLVALGGLVSAIGVTTKSLAEVRAMRVEQEQIREQVQNSHGTNLRDDMDGIRDALGDVQAGQRRHDSELARVHDTQRDIQRAMTEGLERLADADAEDRRRADHEYARIWHVLTPPAPLEDQ